MVARDVERLEVVVVGLDLGPVDDREAQAGEDRHDLVVDARERVEHASRRTPARQCQIEPRARPLGAALRFQRLGQALFEESLEDALGLVRRRADERPLLGGERAERAEELGQDALAAEEPDAGLLELGGRAIELASSAEVALRLPEDLLAPAARLRSTLCPWHACRPSRSEIGHEHLETALVHFVDQLGLAETPAARRTLLLELVLLPPAGAPELPGGRALEALRRPALGLHLRHRVRLPRALSCVTSGSR